MDKYGKISFKMFYWKSVFFLKKIIILVFQNLKKNFVYYYFWLCWVFDGVRGISLVVVSGGYTTLWCAGFSLQWLLVAEHGFQARRLQQLWHAGSVVVARGLQSTCSVVVVQGLSCSAACGIFPDQGSNPCPLHWQVDS